MAQPKPKYRIEVMRSRDKEFYFRCIHRNGREIFRSSEMYARRATMLRTVRNLLKVDYLIVDLTK